MTDCQGVLRSRNLMKDRRWGYSEKSVAFGFFAPFSGYFLLACTSAGYFRIGICRDLSDVAKGGDGAKLEAVIDNSPGL